MKRFGCYVITSEFETIEMHTITCGHCNTLKVVKPKERPEDLGGNCSLCWSLICPSCVERGACDPFEKKLERVENRARTLRTYGL